jgi:hypothetical protein
LINTLYYSDKKEKDAPAGGNVTTFSQEVTKQFWLQDAYADYLPAYYKDNQDKMITGLSPKMQLLKLIEFNKIEMLERISAEGLSGTLAQ